MANIYGSPLPTLVLEIGIPCSELMRSRIMEIAGQYINEPFAIEIQHRPELIGGATITWKGKYFDASIKRVLHEKLSQLGMMAKKQPVNHQDQTKATKQK